MSVKGFQVGNNVEKYDYTELVNKPTIPMELFQRQRFVHRLMPIFQRLIRLSTEQMGYGTVIPV